MMRLRVVWAVAVAGMAVGASAQVPEVFPGVVGVMLVSYDVAGRDAAAIRRSIDAVRPTDPNDGQRVDALSRYGLRWRWRSDGQRHCQVADEDIGFTAIVTAPRLVDPKTPAAVRARFDRYYATLLAHEEGHVRYAWDHRSAIAAAIRAATCDAVGGGADAAAQTALNAIHAHDLAFDRETRHGQATILPFP